MARMAGEGKDRRLTDDEQRRLDGMLDDRGEAEVLEELEVCRATLSRALAGQQLQRATLFLIRAKLGGGGR